MNNTSFQSWIALIAVFLSVIGGIFYYSQTQGKYIEKLDSFSKKTTENGKNIIDIKLKLQDISNATQNPAHLVNKINDIEKEYRKEQEAIKLVLKDIGNATQNPAHLVNRIGDIEKDVILLQELDKNYKMQFEGQNDWIKHINNQITKIEQRVYEVATNISDNIGKINRSKEIRRYDDGKSYPIN